MKKSVFFVVALLLVLSMVLGACVKPVEQTPEPTEEVVVTEAPVEETEEVVVTEEATEEPVAELGPVLKIGQIGMMSGLMALYGQQQQRGFQLGLEYMADGNFDEKVARSSLVALLRSSLKMMRVLLKRQSHLPRN